MLLAGAPAAGASARAGQKPSVVSTFSLHGTVTGVSVKTNRVTLKVKSKSYSLVVSSTTQITLNHKHSTLSHLLGASGTATGRQIGPLMVTETITVTN